MTEKWLKTVITEIVGAVHVTPNTGKTVHVNRPYHGLVFNENRGKKIYYFDDGRVMTTDDENLFYLPKGSTYNVKTDLPGGCFAINFDADISSAPFTVTLRNHETVYHCFKAACDAWRLGAPNKDILAMRALYEGINQAYSESHKEYLPQSCASLISPAVKVMDESFTSNELTVSRLAETCGVSEVYFRQIFRKAYGTSPKEYLIKKRIDYSKALLLSGSFSVKETAELCGYSEPCHFSREFTRRVGVPPNQYLKSK